MIGTPTTRKWTLTAHVTASVGWFGAVATFLALAIAGLVSANPFTVRTAYIAMELTTWAVIVPLCLSSLATGLLQSLSTTWGLFRYRWLVAKLVLTIVATVILLVHTQPIARVAEAATSSVLLRDDLRGLRIQLIADAGAAILALIVATTLSVFKPWGMTDYGRRVSQSVSLDSRSAGATRLWILGLIVALSVFALLHLLSGGMHH